MQLDDIAGDPERVMALCDILSAAAAADEYTATQELDVVASILRRVLSVEALPDDVTAHLDATDPAGIDLDAACARLALDSVEDKQTLLEAAVDIVVADRFVDTSEMRFLATLAAALGMPMPELHRPRSWLIEETGARRVGDGVGQRRQPVLRRHHAHVEAQRARRLRGGRADGRERHERARRPA
ncbi:MAG: TerB family tellurite resistance protein [Myxococcota bacterium]